MFDRTVVDENSFLDCVPFRVRVLVHENFREPVDVRARVYSVLFGNIFKYPIEGR